MITAQIDKALANGTITPARAAALKSDLDDAVLPGYKAVGSGGFDLGKAAHGSAGAQQQQQHRAFRR